MGSNSSGANPREIILMRSLQDIRPEELQDFGGKAINLARLHQLGLPIPRGFVIPTKGFSWFLTQCQHLDSFKVLHQANNDIEIILEAAETFYNDAIDFEIPKNVAREITRELNQLHGNQPAPQRSYAIRSSATIEDTAQLSFAGQADTFLCVSDTPSILEAIKCTWLSIYSPRSLLYLQGKGISLQKVRMGVIVQEMVLGDISGVMFTANASTADRNQLVIDATWGLGESIVSGCVTPDNFIIQKEPLAVLHRFLGTKAVYSTPAPRNRPNCTVFLDTPEERCGIYCLTDAQLFELARLGLQIEEYFGAPQDIEWTFQNGRFVVLQTRPITTL